MRSKGLAILLQMYDTDIMRRTRNDRVELLVRCARMYHEQQRTKRQIAEELGFSPTHVGRLLDEAMARGIVRVSIVERHDFAELEAHLKTRFNLRIARVAPFLADYERQKTSLGLSAAQLFDELATRGTSVGIGGGGSLKAMIEALDPHPREISIAPMALVGRGPVVEYVDAAYLAALLYHKSAPKARALLVGLPPPPKDSSSRQTYFGLVERRIPEVSAVLTAAKESTVAFIGLGGPELESDVTPLLERSGYPAHSIAGRRISGGTNYNYFDADGEEVASLFKTLRLNDLREMAARPEGTVVVVAGGAHKAEALKIALCARFANAVVTDDRTALRLTSGPEGDRPGASN